MKASKIDEIEDKIIKLERDKMAYLEVNNKASARRIDNKIRQLELEKEVSRYNDLKRELKAYKIAVKDIIGLEEKVKNILLELEKEKKSYEHVGL